jgi:hypothetical protein
MATDTATPDQAKALSERHADRSGFGKVAFGCIVSPYEPGSILRKADAEGPGT